MRSNVCFSQIFFIYLEKIYATTAPFAFWASFWFRQTLCVVCLCQPNTTCAEFKFVRPHTCIFNCLRTIMLHFIVILVSNNTTHALWYHPTSQNSSAILACSDTSVRNWPMCRSSQWDILNIHSFELSRACDSPVLMLKPFTAYVSNSGCIIQPPAHGLGHNIGTPMSSSSVLKKLISKEVTRNIHLETLALTVTHACVTRWF